MAYVRRRSAAFSRGKSSYRGVSGHNGRWEARIGSFGGRKNVSEAVHRGCLRSLDTLPLPTVEELGQPA